jgi:hypothetical protein
VVEVGIEGRPVGSGAEAVLDVRQRVAGCAGVVTGTVQLIELCGQPAALFCQRQQPRAARFGGVRQVLLLRGEGVSVPPRSAAARSRLALTYYNMY